MVKRDGDWHNVKNEQILARRAHVKNDDRFSAIFSPRTLIIREFINDIFLRRAYRWRTRGVFGISVLKERKERENATSICDRGLSCAYF